MDMYVHRYVVAQQVLMCKVFRHIIKFLVRSHEQEISKQSFPPHEKPNVSDNGVGHTC